MLWEIPFGKVLMTFFISMIPVVELRGAIPVALAHGMDLWPAILVSVLGNLVPVPFIIIFIRQIFAWIRKKSRWLNRVVTGLEQRAAQKADTVRKYTFWGLFILVAIPLPGTGAWTGALVAAMMKIRIKLAFPAIALGVVAAGLIVAFVTYGAGMVFFS